MNIEESEVKEAFESAQQQVAPRIEKARRNLTGINRRVQGFIRQYPESTVLSAVFLAAGCGLACGYFLAKR